MSSVFPTVRTGSCVVCRPIYNSKVTIIVTWKIAYYFFSRLFVLTLKVLHSFIHSVILNIYIAPLQENYSEVLPTPARLKRAVFGTIV